MYDKIKRAVRRPGRAWLAFRMGCWVLVVTGLMRVLPLPRVLGIVSPRRRGRFASELSPPPEHLAGLLDQILETDFFVFTPTCWKRSAVLHRYLAISGIETKILYGVRQSALPKIIGHAWLEADGVPVYEKEPIDYTVTFVFPGTDLTQRRKDAKTQS